MKLYRNTAQGIIETLFNVLIHRKRATRVLEKIIKANPKWGARDRKIVHQATYEILREKRYYAFLAHTPEDENSTESLWLLLGVWLTINKIELPDWEEFSSFDRKTIISKLKEKPSIDILKSVPDWLVERLKKELPEKWDIELDTLNVEAKLILRANRILISPKKLKEKLLADYQINADFIEGYQDALVLEQRHNLRTNKLYLKGYFEIQDANSQRVASFSDVKQGMNVIDGCAGAGGKSLHLAALMRNKGKIISIDVEKNKLKELSKRAKRNKVKIIEHALPENYTHNASLTNWADLVLIDAPCSGIGTLKRNPELKWQLTEEHLSKTIRLQQTILIEQCKWLKTGGKLVYATCSILPSENQEQIMWFLKQPEGLNFELEEEQTLYAHQTQFDGFYMARLIKKKCE